MREPPPPQLIALLERLGLATASQVDGMAPRVRRLARDLPHFESIWIDALVQTRILTRFQAAEINAGRGDLLRIGPYLLCRPLPWPEYAPSFRAKGLESGETVRLAVLDGAGAKAGKILGSLQALAAAGENLRSEHVAAITEAGADGERLYAVSPWLEGQTAADWMVHNGRFPPEVVLDIARAMLAGLVVLEEAGLCHGDVCASGVILTDAGGVVVAQPGLRAIVRPEEGYTHADLRPEAYDCLAPERITDGTAPNTAADVYACGCVWWHLLCGRPPLTGGNSLAKLRAAQTADVFDVQQLAPDVPEVLRAAVSSCLQREASRRPESIAQLAATLGPPTRGGKQALASCLARRGRASGRWPLSVRANHRSNRTPLRLAATAACAAAAAAVVWPVWRAGSLDTTELRAQLTATSTDRDTGGDNEERRHSDPDGERGNTAGRHENTPGKRVRVVDSAVTPAHHVVEQPARETPATGSKPLSPRPPDLVLADHEPLPVEALDLRAGQCVRGKPHRRLTLLTPRAGLVVDVENVRFENIDFVYEHSADSQAAIVQLEASRARFRGCRFRSASAGVAPAAIRWTHPANANDAAMSLPSGRVRLENCVLRHVGAGVDCRTVGAVAVEMTNTLHLGAGPLVRLDRCPRPDEPVRIALSQVTLRNAGPLLECDCRGIVEQPGAISIEAAACALAPSQANPLILLRGDDAAERLLRNMRWSGQGSLVAPAVMIAARETPDGGREELDDTAVSIAGLVRSEVGFAGDASSDPAASRIIRWQAPLRSADPPGINPAQMPGEKSVTRRTATALRSMSPE